MFSLLLLMCVISTYPCVRGDQKYFRADYRYIDPLESFYKIHTVHSTWSDANQICSAEGADVFYPKSVGEVMEFVRLLLILNGSQSSNLTLNEISNVLTGEINDTFGGIPISDLYTNWGPTPSENNTYPFICKRSYDSFVWNEECNLPFSEYTYNEVTHRCYKFHLNPKNWTDAYDICNQEQSYLAIINSNSEARALVKLTEGMPKEGIMGDYMSGITHLGFLNKNKQGWKTIDGTALEDSGYSNWSRDQPDGPGRGVEELCGGMFYNGFLNDIGCQIKCFFICEHEIKTLSTLRGDRLEKT